MLESLVSVILQVITLCFAVAQRSPSLATSPRLLTDLHYSIMWNCWQRLSPNPSSQRSCSEAGPGQLHQPGRACSPFPCSRSNHDRGPTPGTPVQHKTSRHRELISASPPEASTLLQNRTSAVPSAIAIYILWLIYKVEDALWWSAGNHQHRLFPSLPMQEAVTASSNFRLNHLEVFCSKQHVCSCSLKRHQRRTNELPAYHRSEKARTQLGYAPLHPLLAEVAGIDQAGPHTCTHRVLNEHQPAYAFLWPPHPKQTI